MTTTLRTRLPALAALAIFTITGTSAFAQTPPVPAPDASRQGVREILNRAETEGARRTLGDVLGGAVGISRAQAQTAPAQTPSSAPVLSQQQAAAPATAQAQSEAPAPAATAQ
jgi:hypothetical protein